MRDCVYKLLTESPALQAKGLSPDRIKPASDVDQRLSAEGPFIVIVWGANDLQGHHRLSSRRFDLYVHWPYDRNTNHGDLDAIIDIVDAIFEESNDLDLIGDDGETLSYVVPEGRGPDVKDETYQTILRTASYLAIS